ncbi:hypothetical protein [Sporocytophaga myxococcoides]|nr:hypothetical protein [Sporocytophaga myxococcoides]
MKKNKVLLILALLFLLIMLYISYDMMSRTKKPWEKKKNPLKEINR